MKEYKSEVTRQEFEDLKGDVKDLHKVFDKITDIAMATEKLAIEMKYMREDQNKTEQRLKELEEKPIKRYDSAVNYRRSLYSVSSGTSSVSNPFPDFRAYSRSIF